MANVYGQLPHISDPLLLARIMWPHVNFYDKEKELIRSVWENDKTVVPAGHKLGKDFTAAFIILATFLTHQPCKILTTSVDGPQLEDVLWGEIKRFISMAKFPLEVERGGPLIVNHLHIRKVYTAGDNKGKECEQTYIRGRVAAAGEGMSGHHLDRSDGIWKTLFVGDELSGVDQQNIEKASEWAHRMLLLGNPYDCDNEFKWAVEGGRPGKPDDRGGDLPRHRGAGYRRKIIRITAEDSPNVQYARREIAAGLKPSGKIIQPGVLTWDELQDRLETWDAVKVEIGIHARFYKGAQNLLFPPAWLTHAEEFADSLKGKIRRAKAIGIDTAEGGDKTAWAVIDEFGLIKLISKKTPDTSIIPAETIALGREFHVPPENWIFDRGGGGYQHVSYLRAQGFNCRAVTFHGAPSSEPKLTKSSRIERFHSAEAKYLYKDKRTEMYGELSLRLDLNSLEPFAIPREYTEIRKQLAPIPKVYIEGGVLKLPSKKRKPGSKEVCLEDLIGHSPDEADALVLAEYGRTHRAEAAMKIGAAW